MNEIGLVWFGRNLRCFDHAALYTALNQSKRLYCLFVFDTDILDQYGSFIRKHVPELENCPVPYIHSP